MQPAASRPKPLPAGHPAYFLLGAQMRAAIEEGRYRDGRWLLRRDEQWWYWQDGEYHLWDEETKTPAGDEPAGAERT